MNKAGKWSLITLAIGVFMGALDNGIVTSSLTTLIHTFGVSPSWGAWIITIYTLGLAISVPIIGKLSDRYGRRLLFLIEIGLFGVGSLLVALSPNFTLLLLSRFVQAMGGGGIFILASSYILNTFPKEKQGRALGMIGGMNGIASILGPNLGSFILNLTGSWHWLFIINIPIAILLLIMGSKTIKEEQELVESRLDIAGILVLSCASLSLMYGLTQLKASAAFVLFIVVGAALLGLFIYLEKHAETKGVEPVLPIELLKNRTYRWTLLLAACSGAILASVIFIPSYVEQFLGVDSKLAGYWFTPLAIASGIGAGGGGALIDRKGPTFSLTLSCLVAIVGFALFPIWVTTTWQMVIASCLVGIGFGSMLGAPINILATENSKENKGVALAGASLLRQMGMTIAPTIYAGFLTRSFEQFGNDLQANAQKAGIQLQQGSISQLPQTVDASTMKNAINQIPVPQIRELVQQTLHQTVGRGFNGLFLSAMTVAIIMLVGVFIVRAVRQKAKENASVRSPMTP
ncbi:MFS transporter [Paenibacillus sp. UNC451MF]|uniref:MFS transporter n=1 Tax=Paenibacillus sp. UNC451MF TaxID=1449063 RepID=UPI000490A8A3|nr:MFS transporter [Paenibacillus sp. UNC451MF]